MHPNQALVEKFYTAFQRRDAEAMVACYHPDVAFSDPVFTDLKGIEAMSMWRMLCARGKDLQLTFRDVQADDRTGSAHWEATYTFSVTGNKVHNVIDATFEFKDGLIIGHKDRFDLWRWAGMALGLKGKLLGWTPLVKNAVRKQGMAGLKQFMAR